MSSIRLKALNFLASKENLNDRTDSRSGGGGGVGARGENTSNFLREDIGSCEDIFGDMPMPKKFAQR